MGQCQWRRYVLRKINNNLKFRRQNCVAGIKNQKFSMKKIVFCGVLLGAVLLLRITYAQDAERIKALYSLTNIYSLNVNAVDMSDYKVLDTTLLKVVYSFTYRVTPETTEKFDWMYLDIGERYTKFYSDNYYRMDSLFSYKIKYEIPIYGREWVPCEEILHDKTNGQNTVFNRMTNGPVLLLTYKENTPKIAWTISEKYTRVIAGYNCYYAQGQFGGRTWNVWFTPEIPSSEGPWKLGGLPGLILCAQEVTDCYNFDCIAVKLLRAPVKWYNCKYQETTRSAWRKYEQNLHRAPLETIDEGGTIAYFYKNRRLDKTWTIPYNPLELE